MNYVTAFAIHTESGDLYLLLVEGNKTVAEYVVELENFMDDEFAFISNLEIKSTYLGASVIDAIGDAIIAAVESAADDDDEECVGDDEAEEDSVPSEDPKDYVFGVGNNDCGDYIVLTSKAIWYRENRVDDSGHVPAFADAAGLCELSESLYEPDGSMSINKCANELLKLGVTHDIKLEKSLGDPNYVYGVAPKATLATGPIPPQNQVTLADQLQKFGLSFNATVDEIEEDEDEEAEAPVAAPAAKVIVPGSQSPADYVFGVGISAGTQYIVLTSKSHWDTYQDYDDSGFVPDFAANMGLSELTESVYTATGDLSLNKCAMALKKLGVVQDQDLTRGLTLNL